jgi:hypothetical protein
MKKSKRGKGKKGAMQFAWIFAIIVGAVILFLTFFFLGREIFTQEQQSGIEEVYGLDILLGPFTYLGSISEATSNEINLYTTTKLDFDCNSLGLGYSTIILEKKSITTNDIYDKYLYGDKMETKKIAVISKPFKMPFRVADLIYLAQDSGNDKTYCFVNPPLRIENELNNLDINGFEFYNSIGQCSQGTISICFDVSATCDIKVYDKSSGSMTEYEIGEVRKGQDRIYFVGNSLMYGAIFSSKEVYNCNLERLVARIDPLISIYRDKNLALSQEDCDENYNIALAALDSAALNLDPENFNSLLVLYNNAQELEILNDQATCKLY